MDVYSISSYFVNSRNIRLFTQAWLPTLSKEVAPSLEFLKGREFIVILHGYTNHSSTFIAETATWFAERGYCCFSFDQESMGASRLDMTTGKSTVDCHIPNFNFRVQDAISFIQSIIFKQYAGLNNQVILMGDSMGGAIASYVALLRSDLVKGLVLTAPMLSIAPESIPPTWQIFFLQILSSFFPTLPLIDGPPVRQMFRDEKAFLKDQADPLTYHGRVRLLSGLELYRASLSFFSNSATSVWSSYIAQETPPGSGIGVGGKITVPVFIGHGNADTVCPHESSVQFMREKCIHKLSKLKVFSGVCHAIHQDPDTLLVRAEIKSWLEQVSLHNRVSVPELLIYDHCPFCNLVRTAIGIKKLPIEQRILAFHDEETPTKLIGSKKAPILVKQDGSAMPESLDIAKYLDNTYPPQVFTSNSDQNFVDWLAKLSKIYNFLLFPRWKELKLKEFEEEESWEYFEAKKTKMFGVSFPELLAKSETYTQETNQLLVELASLLHSENFLYETLSFDDLVLFGRLRGLTAIKQIHFPEKVQNYIQNMSARSGLPLFTANAV